VGGAVRGLSRDRRLVLHLAPSSDGARSPRRGLRGTANPTSIPPQEIDAWTRRRNVKHLGFVEDIAALWGRAHIAVLPSRGGEGLPLSLLEAAACGRPLVATDVPGCRDIALANLNALLVPLDDAAALADAIDRLARDPQLRRKSARPAANWSNGSSRASVSAAISLCSIDACSSKRLELVHCECL